MKVALEISGYAGVWDGVEWAYVGERWHAGPAHVLLDEAQLGGEVDGDDPLEAAGYTPSPASVQAVVLRFECGRDGAVTVVVPAESFVEMAKTVLGWETMEAFR
jgi:hypothetical protein